jgi:hypothetical protein
VPAIIIQSLRGGMNNSDPPISLADDQCVTAQNVEFWLSTVGERRRGSIAIDVTGSDFLTTDTCVFVYRHLPTTDLADAQLWVLAIRGGATAILAYKDTTWHTVTMSDALTIDGVSEYQVQAQTLHGKLFLAYNSSVDRLHVWDGTSLRRVGLEEPAAAPTAADSGGGGSLDGNRYYRTRETVQVATVTTLRSEPSATLTHNPDGAHAAVTVTKPTTANTNATHWELEASVDNANFYIIATTVIGTTTATDSQDYATGYATAYDLSEDSGDYSLIPSVRYLAADEDRLVLAGSFEDESIASRVMWTPVYAATGVGNDERLALDTDPFTDLDNYEGGGITALSNNVQGYNYVTKHTHTYQMSRRGVPTAAYEFIPLSKQRGAVSGSLVEAFDNGGRPFLFCVDPDIGPCRIGGEKGIEPCGADLRVTWDTINVDAVVVARGVYIPDKKQVHWWLATGSSDVPDTRVVLQTNEMRPVEDGSRRGWSIWTGPSASALAVCLFADNIDDDVDRSLFLVPFIGIEGDGLVWRTETGDDDNGTDYSAIITSKPFIKNQLLHQFEILNGSFIAKAATGGLLDVTVIGNFGASNMSNAVSDIALDASGSETHVIKALDDLSLAELKAVQVKFSDPATPGTRWELSLCALNGTAGQGA